MVQHLLHLKSVGMRLVRTAHVRLADIRSAACRSGSGPRTNTGPIARPIVDALARVVLRMDA
jgi:hypothetical protein